MKKRKKKIVGLLLVICMVMSCFVGCGSEEEGYSVTKSYYDKAKTKIKAEMKCKGDNIVKGHENKVTIIYDNKSKEVYKVIIKDLYVYLDGYTDECRVGFCSDASVEGYAYQNKEIVISKAYINVAGKKQIIDLTIHFDTPIANNGEVTITWK